MFIANTGVQGQTVGDRNIALQEGCNIAKLRFGYVGTPGFHQRLAGFILKNIQPRCQGQVIVQQAIAGEGQLGAHLVGFIAGLIELVVAIGVHVGEERRGGKPGPEGLAVQLGIHLIAQPIAVRV